MKTYLATLMLITLTSCNNLDGGLLKSIGITKREVIIEQKKGIVLVADGTYSGSSIYKVPMLSSSFVSQIIDSLRENRGGIIWVTYIDNISDDNETIQFEVPVKRICSTPMPTVKDMGYLKLPEEKSKWEKIHQQELNDSLVESKIFRENKLTFVQKVNQLLTSTVYVHSARNQWSDVNGTINSAIKILEIAIDNQSVEEGYIVGFSDYEDDAKRYETEIIDEKLKVYNLISQPGKSKRTISKSIELISEQDVLRIITF